MGWVRVTGAMERHAVADNMKRTLAKQYGEPLDNFSVVAVGR
jgi:hypothetical protein